jgi:hypothetical protein
MLKVRRFQITRATGIRGGVESVETLMAVSADDALLSFARENDLGGELIGRQRLQLTDGTVFRATNLSIQKGDLTDSV